MTHTKLTKEQCFPPSYDGLKTLILPFKRMICEGYKKRKKYSTHENYNSKVLCDYCHMELFGIG